MNSVPHVIEPRFTFDYNGNTATKADSTGTAQYFWDFENRMTSVTLPGSGGTVSFKYDPFGRRIYKSSSSGTSIFAYDGDNLIEETNSSGAAIARYSQTQNIDEPLAMLRSGTTSYYHADGLGSVTSLSTGTGSLAQTYGYDAFGKQLSSTGPLTNPFQYTGRESDTETGLYYYRARYYDQNIGRFLGEDSTRFASGTCNFYPYVNNDPLNHGDAFGLQKDSGETCCQENIDIGRKELEKALNNVQLLRGRIVKKYKDCLLKTLPILKIKCNPTSKDCGLHVSVAVDTIAVTPLGSKGRKGPCGPLASTFLHEMIHLCYNLDLSAAPMPRSEQEKEAQQAECEVFGFNCRKR